MSSNNDFLLKIHMEEAGNIKEIVLDNEGCAFSFFNDECISDFVVPESKVSIIKMILNKEKDVKDTDDYIEYTKNGEQVKVYDKKKMNILTNVINKLSVNDFFDCLENVKINDYYVENIIKAYNCVLPKDVKEIISYTTNGAVFNGDDNIYVLPHYEIVNYKGNINSFIPIMMRNDSNYIGYDYKESLYKEYLNQNLINESKTLRGLVITSRIEMLDLDADYEIDNEEKQVDSVQNDETIKNIDLQLERLSNGVIDKNQKEEKQKQLIEKETIQKEIRDSIKKSIVELEQSSNSKTELESVINSDITIKKNNIKTKNNSKTQTSKSTIKNSKIKEQKESLIDKKELEEKKQKEINDLLLLENMINLSIDNGLENYKINFNDTQKLVVEHLPYYEYKNDFNVIQIPEIEIDKITLLPDGKLDFGKIKLIVSELENNKVDLLVQSASSIVDKENNKIKNGMHLILDLKNEITLRLNKKDVMETWTFKMEQSTFTKELRNIDYGKVMNYISQLSSYKKLGNIEKYELQKSVMLFIDSVMTYKEEDKLEELYNILENEPTLYEEFITRYNIGHSLELKDCLSSYEHKKEYVTKLNYVNGLIDAKWLDYPRYIFESHNYFSKDNFLQDFIYEIDGSIKENDFSDYLKKLFKVYEIFNKLDSEGKENLNKCLEYLSLLYKYDPCLGENNKYQIERNFMIGATEEDMALLISKLCRRGIKDYSQFVEYDMMMKGKYRLGELKYPIFSESFGIEEIRNGGEYDEY